MFAGASVVWFRTGTIPGAFETHAGISANEVREISTLGSEAGVFGGGRLISEIVVEQLYQGAGTEGQVSACFGN
jgi:hypothetical protein